MTASSRQALEEGADGLCLSVGQVYEPNVEDEGLRRGTCGAYEVTRVDRIHPKTGRRTGMARFSTEKGKEGGFDRSMDWTGPDGADWIREKTAYKARYVTAPSIYRPWTDAHPKAKEKEKENSSRQEGRKAANRSQARPGQAESHRSERSSTRSGHFHPAQRRSSPAGAYIKHVYAVSFQSHVLL
ncbi:hypothetical protein AXG93_3818s1480 [Marchantia polymorpha subsp. ruderalis]|uniref:Uncharacterized protein n=1 Tax=Marchantia polymorpha subsp. ruderalis TaxID=1480154 RepID=A0A176VGV0_MARPO|nr:hypothetical protein AXG93_3818s1480 [Marchantia polymorpha subsp. ruderalis]